MNRVTFAIFTALGFILASVLLLELDAFALFPACTASAPYCTGCDCQCCQSSTVAGIYSIPETIYSTVGNQAPCTGVPQVVTSLPFTDESSTRQPTLPTPTKLGYTYIYTNSCPSGETCQSNGSCCVSTGYGACTGCTPNCGSSCPGTKTDNCGNTQSCQIYGQAPGCSGACSTTAYADTCGNPNKCAANCSSPNGCYGGSCVSSPGSYVFCTGKSCPPCYWMPSGVCCAQPGGTGSGTGYTYYPNSLTGECSCPSG